MVLKHNEDMSYYGNDCVKIHRKSIRRIIIYLTLFLTIVVLGCFTLMASEPNENAAQKAVESFLKQLAENKITRIEVYYKNFYLLIERAITEDLLRDYSYDYKVIAKNPNLAEVAKALREFKFEKVDGEVSDFRWGCVFYDEDKEIFRLFFPNAPIVAVNGVGYKATPELIGSLMQFLPVKVDEEMNKFIKEQWGQFGPGFTKQQATPLEQKKSDKP